MKQEDPAQLWSVCLSELRGMIPPQTYATWFERTKGHDVTPDTFTIEVQNPFAGERILKRYHDMISQVVTTQLGRQVSIDYHIFEGNTPIVPVLTDLPSYGPERELQPDREEETGNLYDNYTFEHFVVGGVQRLRPRRFPGRG